MTDNPVMTFWYVLSNVAILGGYLFMGCFVAPRVKVAFMATKIGGALFFILCGLTHLSLSYYTLYRGPDGHGMAEAGMASSPAMVLLHAAQAVAVWVFVVGLYVELGRFGGLGSDVKPGIPAPRSPSE